MKYLLDKKTNTVFTKDKIGSTIFLKGINVDGLYRLKKLDDNFVEINEEDIKKYKSTGMWIERLVNLMTAKSRIVHLDFSEKPKKKKVVRRKAKKMNTEGMISIGQICEELGIDPKKARAKLRSKMEKPECGWKWQPEEVNKIKELL
jgi:hypothetical protein